MFPPSLYLSLVFTCKMSKKTKSGWSISHHEEQVEGKQDRWPVSKIDLRARSVCVCYFAYLVMKMWPHCNLLLMYIVVCNPSVSDFASQETCLCDYLCAIQFFVWFTYSLASMKKNKPTRAG
jgi:hypothetical protein